MQACILAIQHQLRDARETATAKPAQSHGRDRTGVGGGVGGGGGVSSKHNGPIAELYPSSSSKSGSRSSDSYIAVDV